MQLFQKIGSCGAAIVVGPPLSGKEGVIQGFVSFGLGKNEPLLFITTDRASEELKKELLAKKIYYGNRMKFIDCYSRQTNELCKDTGDITRVSGPLALNEISIALSEVEAEFVKKSPRHRVVFDSLSTVLMYTNPQTVGRFAQVLIARIKKAGGSVLFSIEEGMHEPSAIVTIEHLMDCIIEVKKEKGKTLVKARGLEGFDDWQELKAQK